MTLLLGLIHQKQQFSDFKCGRTDTDVASRSGRPNSAVVPENVEKVLKMVLTVHKKGNMFTILHHSRKSKSSIHLILFKK